MSPASVCALLAKELAQIKLTTLAALCVALQCTPSDLLELEIRRTESPRTGQLPLISSQNASISRRLPTSR